ncbi:hypothetical protein CPC16_007200 [Podila verticillata]|nr:hypothetical protein CPC16_007200 [Podila verticillata]KAI9242103.1 MAG: hypothetical protein BYD32DRAFT_404400 [Podila humilis]
MSAPRFIPRYDGAAHCFHGILKLFLQSPVDRRLARRHGYATRPLQGLDIFSFCPRTLLLTRPCAFQSRSFSSAPLPLPPRTSSTSKSPTLRIDTTGRKRNNAAWTPEADRQLLNLRAQGHTWTQIGEVLGKSRQACNRRYDSELDPKLGRNFWEEDPDRVEILTALVQQKFTWGEIGEQLGTKGSSCEKQWRIIQRQNEEANGVEAMSPPKFSRKDLATLKAAVMDHGTQWDIIARETFGSVFAPTQLRRQFMNQERKRCVWTAEQEASLSMTVATSYGDIPDITQCDNIISVNQWQSIANQIPGDHTGVECKARWLKLRVLEQRKKPTKRHEEDEDDRGSWTQEQSALLRELIEDIKAHGLRRHANEQPKIDWDWVAEEMGGAFTRAQCKSRWTRMSRNTGSTRAGAWQPQELEAMVMGLCQEGASWTVIHREHLSSRSPSFIQGKWKSMAAKIRQDMVIHQRLWPESCKELFHGILAETLQELEKQRPELCSY